MAKTCSGRLMPERHVAHWGPGSTRKNETDTQAAHALRGAGGDVTDMTPSHQSYAGDVAPEAAWTALQNDPHARIVDVRTQPEWTFVGVVDAGAGKPDCIMQQWQAWPHMAVDGGFVASLASQLEQSGADKSAPLYFLCRSGVRSLSAALAMTQAGYGPCYNIAGGFEGDVNGDRHRGVVNGWKAAGLPWRQG